MRILDIVEGNFKDIVKESVIVIKQGRVLVSPTDTVYGLLADAANQKSVEKVFSIKKRSKEKPLPVFVKDIKMAKTIAYVNNFQEKFLKKVWPGKTTVVLKIKQTSELPKVLSKNGTIALRIPDYKFIKEIIRKTKKPLTGTSANISGKPASTKFTEILRQFKDRKLKPDLFLDAGDLPESLPSTIIDLTQKTPKVLREGEASRAH